MAPLVSYGASTLLLESLPNLDIPALQTTSHALHRVKFVGALCPWANFSAEVVNTYNGQTWNPRPITSKLTGNFFAGSVNEEFNSDSIQIQFRLSSD
ncbi:hypothetical protein VN97_g11947 [Penicillium thymicola]|uniref:Uncharacterized protein n=1 Tax=Penicillium thymicola TaxID=293382 RepID=A0AAI9X2W9_PENTH|nr:hypothetical protein VN97_g11947 [Penicillium thymicola]